VWEIIVDRGTGAAEKVAAEGLEYRFAFGLADLGLDKHSRRDITYDVTLVDVTSLVMSPSAS